MTPRNYAQLKEFTQSDRKLIERTFVIDDISPVDFFGINNDNLKLLQLKYPKLKIVAREMKLWPQVRLKKLQI